GVPTASVDNRTGRHHLNAGRLQGFDYLRGGTTGGNDVFDEDGALARGYREAAAQRHLIDGGVALSENEARSQSPRHFVSNDQPAQGRSYYQVHWSEFQLAQFVRQKVAKLLRRGGM